MFFVGRTVRFSRSTTRDATGEIDIAGKIDCQTIARAVAKNISLDSVINDFSSVDSRMAECVLSAFLRNSFQMQASIPVNTAFSDVVSVHGHSPHELLFGQRVSDALEATLNSDDILPANSESHESRQERRCLALHAVHDSVSAARLRRTRARSRKYIT